MKSEKSKFLPIWMASNIDFSLFTLLFPLFILTFALQ